MRKKIWTQQRSKGLSRALQIFLGLLIVVHTHTSAETLQFQTVDQGLFGPDSTVIEKTFLPLTLASDATAYDDSVSPPVPTATKVGEIYHDIPTTVPLSVLQGAWNQALQTCTGYRYSQSFSVGWPGQCTISSPYTVSPTTSECISGNVNRTKSVTCCTTPLDQASNGCNTNPFTGKKLQKTVTVTVNRSFGGIGPEPTQASPQPFSVGAEVSYLASYDVGLELAMRLDSGTVDVDYQTDANLTVSQAAAKTGDVVTLSATHTPNANALKMVSRYPSISFAYQYFIDAQAYISAEYAHMSPTGTQIHTTQTVFDYSTANLPDADSQGRLVGELVSIELSLGDKAKMSIFNDNPAVLDELADFPNGLEFEIPISFTKAITYPYNSCENTAGGEVCPSVIPQITTDLIEISVSIPLMNTPADVGEFDAGYVDFENSAPLLPLIDELIDHSTEFEGASAGDLVSTTPVGFRKLLDGGFVGNLALEDAKLSTDFARLDLDLDGILSALTPPPVVAPLPPKNPLGGNFSFGSAPDPDQPTAVKPALTIEYNFLDIDFANWFSLDQSLIFSPQMMVLLEFSPAVRIKLAGETEFSAEPMASVEMTVEAFQNSELEFLQPDGGVQITPVYSLRNNRFRNLTGVKWTSGLQQSLGQLKVEGVIPAILGGALGLPPLNVSLLQTTLASPPVHLGNLFDTDHTLGGFVDVPGQAITVQDANIDSDEDGMPDWYEQQEGLNTNADDSAADLDGDGLTNLEEFELGLLASNPDTDGDQIPDGWEIFNDFDAEDAGDASLDLDQDQLNNLEEYLSGTNPNIFDDTSRVDASSITFSHIVIAERSLPESRAEAPLQVRKFDINENGAVDRGDIVRLRQWWAQK